MSLIPTEEQTLLRDSARGFLAELAPISQLRQLRDRHDAKGFAPALWQRFADMGYAGLLVPEAYGGSAAGIAEAAIVMEQIGRQLCASPFLASSVLAVTALRRSGNTALQSKWLPMLANGTCLGTLAVDEHAKHQPARIATVAEPHGDGWRLNGEKCFVLDGHVATFWLVAASCAAASGAGPGIGLFLVPANAQGASCERTVMVDAHNAARLQLRHVELPRDALLGAVDDGAALLDAVLDAGRAAVAAELLGLADAVFERTLGYLKERRQFGKPIGEFQALQHRAAALFVDIELARAALARALHSLDNAEAASATRAVCVAKAKAVQAGTLAVQEAVQMHGGMGMTDEFDIGLFMKRARVLAELFGDAGFHMDRLAAMRGY